MTPSLLSLLFGFRERVPRRLYLQVGLGLMLLKYVMDAGIIAATTGRVWTPLDYLVPLLTLRSETVEALPVWLTVVLVLWTLPFLWIGVGMTMRRAIDAGRSPWWCLAFFLPGLNYVVMIALSILPRAAHVDWDASPVRATAVRRLRSAGAGVAASIGVVLLSVVVGVFVLETYGLALFLATPFLVGVVTAYAYNRGHPRTFGETWGVVLLSLLMVGGTMILFALEGLLCILMALPVGMLTALFGGAVGRAIAIRSGAPPPAVAYGLLLLPGTALMDAVAPADPVFEAVTAIEIDAPPERVWEAVVAFRDIEEAPGLPFRLGIASPLRASITGTGVGAVRYCEFSTGSFVEPITVWDAPRRLSFDVVEQPPVLQEWSPYRNVYAPHVHGFFRSERGEFRLTPLPDGRTRLEGSTWYTLDIHPRPYWRWISEALLHRIHIRVLRQVQRQAEGGPAERAEASLAGDRGHAL